MSQEQYLKSPCAHCQGRISFPASARGMTVTCPHCGQQTVLDAAVASPTKPSAVPQPAATPKAVAASPARPVAAKPPTEAQKAAHAAARVTNPAARPSAKPADKNSIVVKAQWADGAEDAPATKPQRCDFCGVKLLLGATKCPDCGTVVTARPDPAGPVSWFRRIGVALILILALAAVWRWGQLYWERRPKLGKDGQPRKEGVELLNHSLQQQPGTSLLYVRGNVTNHSDVPWFEVKVVCELLDKTGVPLGKFSDTKIVLDPHKLFPFNIAVLDPDAKSYTNITVTAIR